MVALALIGSAWLAYATTAPKTGTYPVTAKEIQGHGWCGAKNSHTHFSFDIFIGKDGTFKGTFTTQLGLANKDLSFDAPGRNTTFLLVSGTTGQFSIVGELHGHKNKDHNSYIADVHATGQIGQRDQPGVTSTISIKVHNSKVIYNQSCVVQGGRIVIPKQ